MRKIARLRPRGLRRGSLRSLRYDGLSGLAQPKLAKRAKAGGARRDRTADLVIANDALSQLSYGPIATASTLTTTRQSAPFTIRTKVKSRTAKTPFQRHLPGTSLVCGRWNRYLASSLFRDRTPE